jgi:molybdopterin/thiamine biosynthesis adenylyltransferase/molybdopterin synthase catalytic subunit/rhodanese-related sulfurtransferase
MAAFRFSRTAIDAASLRQELADPTCGGYASFEGLVRNHNEGMSVRHLEYEAFEPLAAKEGERILAEAIERFGIEQAACVHRIGDLAIGEMAVWVGVSARHRDEAFRACRYIIDEVKHRVPIWKKEHYENGDSGWVNCERCAAAPRASDAAARSTHQHHHDHHHGHDHVHAHGHDHGEAQPRTAPPGASPVPDYSRQIALKEVGARGQATLRVSRVLVVGCGGLGVPVISYLAGAGIGRLGLLDSDRLEPSNLHRQTMYALADVGKLKAELAAERVRALNPDVDTRVHAVRFQADNALELVSQYDLVVDCTDNFSTKFLLNDVCVQQRVPIVFSSVYQYEGQLQVVRADRDGPCLRCVWPEATRDGIVGNCSEAGVLGPVPGTFGSLQAFEALKLLLDLPGQLGQEIIVLDLLTMSVSRVRTKRATNCPEHARVALARAQKPEPTPVEVSFDSLDDALAAGFEVVDIRDPQELADTPTPTSNARHIPMAELLHGKRAFAPAAAKTLLVCASGRRSLAAAQELRSRGLASVYSFHGGISKLRQRIPA